MSEPVHDKSSVRIRIDWTKATKGCLTVGKRTVTKCPKCGLWADEIETARSTRYVHVVDVISTPTTTKRKEVMVCRIKT